MHIFNIQYQYAIQMEEDWSKKKGNCSHTKQEAHFHFEFYFQLYDEFWLDAMIAYRHYLIKAATLYAIYSHLCGKNSPVSISFVFVRSWFEHQSANSKHLRACGFFSALLLKIHFHKSAPHPFHHMEFFFPKTKKNTHTLTHTHTRSNKKLEHCFRCRI